MFIALLGSHWSTSWQKPWTAPDNEFLKHLPTVTQFIFTMSATGMFLTEGNAYGTQASLGTTGYPICSIKTDRVELM